MPLDLVSDDLKTYEPVPGCAIRYRCISPRTLKQLTRACITDERGLRVDEDLLTRKVLAWAITAWEGVHLDGEPVEPSEETIERLPPGIYATMEILVLSRGGLKKIRDIVSDLADKRDDAPDAAPPLTPPEGETVPLSP